MHDAAHKATIHAERFRAMSQSIETEIMWALDLGEGTTVSVLRSLFKRHALDPNSREERQAFLRVAAPIARRVFFQVVPPTMRIGRRNITYGECDTFLRWMRFGGTWGPDTVDLVIFGGCKLSEAAEILGRPKKLITAHFKLVRHAFHVDIEETGK